MILILSEFNDFSTLQVIEWLDYYNENYFTINVEDDLELKSLEIDNFIIRKNNKEEISYSQIKSVWFRRCKVNLKINFNINKTEFDKYLTFYIKNELLTIEYFINYLLTQKKHLGNPFLLDVNKLEVLFKASKIGLKTPFFKVINNKKDLVNMMKSHIIITKSLGNSFRFHSNEKNYMTFTEKIDDSKIITLADSFFYSLCQNLVEKDFDIRVFFINKKFYSMIIYSQKRKESMVDFRKYSYDNPDKRTPIKLPIDIERKLTKLLKKIGLNTGSIDMVQDKNGELFFLEVNPIGQFGMVEHPCNYGINRKIANFLK